MTHTCALSNFTLMLDLLFLTSLSSFFIFIRSSAERRLGDGMKIVPAFYLCSPTHKRSVFM